MAMSASGGGSVRAEPNVTPLIDVMLVLLIIFMIVTPLINSGFQAQPPDGINIKAHPEENDDVVLGIDANGQYYLDKKPIQNSTLAARTREIFTAPGRQEFIMYLKADRNLKYSKVLDAIDIIEHNGVHVMAAITDQTPGTRSTVPGDILSPTPNKQP
ncbi:MAG TPA: biopolymer transporter ExbD [Gemmatimonadaceae bacterium]|jgi:biopolymer transport protein TolR|nr:biopolymer transporter ExbD [Gemmatimonadaceae bacterium]